MPQATAMTHAEDLRCRAATRSPTPCSVRPPRRPAATSPPRAPRWPTCGWWALSEHLGVHPQAAYEQYRGAAEGLRTPAQQR